MRRGLILVLGGAATACAILVACGDDELPIVDAADAALDGTTADVTQPGDSGNNAVDTGSAADTGSRPDTGSEQDAGLDSGGEDGGQDPGDGGEFDGGFDDAGADDDGGDSGILPDGGPAVCNTVTKGNEVRTTCTTRAVVYNGGTVRPGLYQLIDADMQQVNCSGVQSVSVASAIRVTVVDGGPFRFERIFEVDGGVDQIRNYNVQPTDAGNSLSARRTCPAPLNPLARPETWSYNSTLRVVDGGPQADLLLQHPFPNVPGANAILRYRRVSSP